MTAPRFLIDETLSSALVDPARRRGFEAMHVNYLGLRTETDWDLLKVFAEQDWVPVTNNAIEFRGRYRDIELHPGVIFLLPAIRRAEQLPLVRGSVASRQHRRRHGQSRGQVGHYGAIDTMGPR